MPESNGRVGMIGSSYEGFTVVMALVHPHPALKVAAPRARWSTDGWVTTGSTTARFVRPNFDYITGQTAERGAGDDDRRARVRRLREFRHAGSAGDFARPPGSISSRSGGRSASIRPTTLLAGAGARQDDGAQPLTVPTMWIQGLWDQEDMWGAIHCYTAVKPKAGRQRSELPGDGPVASQPGEL